MSEQSITLGGKQRSEVVNNNVSTAEENNIPKEFIDNEFAVPTEEVNLPSEGIFYPNKKSTIRIKYLTANEENILLSPDLIKSGKVLDVLLESTILDKDLRPEQMLVCDRNAALINLRINGYGDDYEVKMTCPECKEDYQTTVKLSSLKHKKLELPPDANGEFTIDLPKTKFMVKFRFLTGKDENYLTKKADQTKKTKTNMQYSTLLTERYLLQIMEINGNRDKAYIKKAIESLPISDSLFFREYIKVVEPGLDMEHEFECKHCGHIYEETVPIGPKLFWPNSKI
jgi:rubredoxin